MSIFFVALMSIVLSVAAQFLLKAGMSSSSVKAALEQPVSFASACQVITNHLIVGGFVLYGVGALVWLAVLSRWDVSRAYPLVGFGFVLTAIVGAALGEQVTLLRSTGILLICAGVFIVSRS